MPVKYEGRIPKTLRTYAEKHAHQIIEVTWSDGYAHDDHKGAYDAFLAAGWCDGSDPYGAVHTVIDPTVAGLIQQLRNLRVCDCDDCRAITPVEV